MAKPRKERLNWRRMIVIISAVLGQESGRHRVRDIPWRSHFTQTSKEMKEYQPKLHYLPKMASYVQLDYPVRVTDYIQKDWSANVAIIPLSGSADGRGASRQSSVSE